MKATKGTIDQLLHGQRVPVEAAVYGLLALHPAPWKPGARDWRYTITHVPTGATVRNVRTLREGKGYIADLLALEGITWEAPTHEDIRRIQAILDSLPPPVTLPALSERPAVLKPLYAAPARSVDSPALQRDARRLTRLATEWFNGGDSAAFLGAVRASTDFEWREVIVARMAAGRHAVILPSDVPEAPRSVGNIELGLRPTKRSFKALWALGTRIEDHAKGMLTAAREWGDSWTLEEERWWEEWEAALQAMIVEGWMAWGGCVSQFIHLTQAEQQPFVDWLGFLGSEKKGWHALGKKTFLRGPSLAELLPLRRAVKERMRAYE